MPAVFGAVAVVAQNKNAALRNGNRKCVALLNVCRGVGVVLLQRHAVHINDAGLKINIHRLAFRCNDTFDDGLPVIKGFLTCHDDVTGLRIMIEHGAGHKNPVAVQECRIHGRAGNDHNAKQQ